MNQSKFSLADLLTALGAIGFGFLCFLSLNFLTLGDTQLSVIVSTVIGFVLGGLAFGLKLLKQTSRKFKTCIIWEWMLLFLFVITAFMAVSPFSHYFAVSAQKEKIQQKNFSNITQAESIFTAYESYALNRLNIYESRLKSIVTGKSVNPSEYRNYGFVDGTDDEIQIENKVFTLKAQLYPSNYKEMKLVGSTWLANSKAKIKNWSPTGIIKIINTVETEITFWLNQLKEYSAFRAQGEIAEDFNYPLNFKNTTNDFTKIANPTVLSIVYSIGLYVLMLFSYFITKKHPRYPGLKIIFGRGSVKENEL